NARENGGGDAPRVAAAAAALSAKMANCSDDGNTPAAALGLGGARIARTSASWSRGFRTVTRPFHSIHNPNTDKSHQSFRIPQTARNRHSERTFGVCGSEATGTAGDLLHLRLQ